MKKSLSHLPPEKQAELKEICDYILETVPVDMIILFGSYARGNWVEDSYVEYGTRYEYKSDYDLLLVVEDEQKANRKKFSGRFKRKVARHIESETTVNAIYHGIDYLNKEIEEGNYFFNDILKEGIILHDSKRFKLSVRKKQNAHDRKRKAQMYFDNWFENANTFFKTFQYNLKENDLNVAAFQLHQTAERYFMTIMLVFTDYKPKTHDLEELNQKAIVADSRFKAVFPKRTVEEKRLFQLLKKAYIDSRYTIGYSVEKKELEYLGERVGILRDLTESICQEKIEGFGIEK